MHPLKFAGTPPSSVFFRVSRAHSHDTGKSAADKLSDLRSYLRTAHTAATSSSAPAPSPSFLLTTLNPIAWLLNLRGSDIPNDPVFYAYLLVPLDRDVQLWVQNEAVTPELQEAMKEIGGKIEPYEEALEALGGVQGKVVADAKISWAVVDRVGEVRILPPTFPPHTLTWTRGHRTTSRSSSRRSRRPRRSRTKRSSPASARPISATAPRGCAGRLGSRSSSRGGRRSPSGTRARS